MQKKWIRLILAAVAVPVIATGAFQMVKAYEDGTAFQPALSNRELQVNQVVFSGDEDTTSQKNNEEKEGESELWEKDRTAEDTLSPELKNSADYLFQTGSMNLPNGAENINLAGEEAGNSSLLPGDGTNGNDNSGYIYDVTGDRDNADLVISNGGQNGGNSGMGTGGEDGQGGTTPTVTPNPSNPSQTPAPEPTTRPVDSVKDPEPNKSNPGTGNINGVWNQPFKEDQSELKSDQIKITIVQSALVSGDNLLYLGQKVNKKDIYCALDTYVETADGKKRFLWGSDDLDKYVQIRAVSFDDGATWITEFPVTIPMDAQELKIRTAYRLSENSDWIQTPEDTLYKLEKAKVYILSQKVSGDTIQEENIVNTLQYPQVGTKVNLLYQQELLLKRIGQNVIFPGWVENGEPVDWFYEVTPGRHILEPSAFVPVGENYTVDLVPHFLTEDYIEDFWDGAYSPLQTLTGYTGSMDLLSVPEGIQALDLSTDEGKTEVDELIIPSSVIHMNTDSVLVHDKYQVDEDNLFFTSIGGVLLDKEETEIVSIPNEIETFTIPDTVRSVNMPDDNQIRNIVVEAENKEQLPEIAIDKLKNCEIRMDEDLVEEFFRDCKDIYDPDKNVKVAAVQDPQVTYTLQNDTIVNNRGELQKCIKTGGTGIYLADNITTIKQGAFLSEDEEQSAATMLVLARDSEAVTLEEGWHTGSDITTIQCYTEKQADAIRTQLKEQNLVDDVTVQLLQQSRDGYVYTVSGTGSRQEVILLEAPSRIEEFDGQITDENGKTISVTVIGDGAFSKCENLTWVSLSKSVKRIGAGAFKGCTSLEGILIEAEDSILIGDKSLDDCDSLRFVASNAIKAQMENDYNPIITDLNATSWEKKQYYFYVPTGAEGYGSYAIAFSKDDNVKQYAMVDLDADGKCKVLYGVADGRPWLAIRSGSTVPEEVTLPESTVEIYVRAFANTSSVQGSYTLKWTAIPELIAVDEKAFYKSELSGDITFGADAEYYLMDEAFEECHGITSVKLPGTARHLGLTIFQNCTALKSVEFTHLNSNTALYTGTFEGCKNLTDIYFGDSNAELAYTFYSTGFGYRFNMVDWETAEEEVQQLHLHVPAGSEETYIKKWRYLFAGYAQKPSYQEMWNYIREQNFDWDAAQWPEDSLVDELAKETLLTAENHLRTMLGMEQVTEPTDYYPYHVADNGFITLVGAPSNVTDVRLDAATLEMPAEWSLDIVGTDAFRNSKNLQSVTFEDSIVAIRSNAFRGVESDNLTLIFLCDYPPDLLAGNDGEPFTFGVDADKLTIIVPTGSEALYYKMWNEYGITIDGYDPPEMTDIATEDISGPVSSGDAMPSVSDGDALTQPDGENQKDDAEDNTGDSEEEADGNAEPDSTQEETVK